MNQVVGNILKTRKEKLHKLERKEIDMPRKKKRMINVDLTKSQYVELIAIVKHISDTTFNTLNSPMYPPQRS